MGSTPCLSLHHWHRIAKTYHPIILTSLIALSDKAWRKIHPSRLLVFYFPDINERFSNISSCTYKHECPICAARHPLLNQIMRTTNNIPTQKQNIPQHTNKRKTRPKIFKTRTNLPTPLYTLIIIIFLIKLPSSNIISQKELIKVSTSYTFAHKAAKDITIIFRLILILMTLSISKRRN